MSIKVQLKHEERYGWSFWKLIKRKDETTDVFSVYKADKKGTPDGFIVSAARRKVLMIHWAVKMPECR